MLIDESGGLAPDTAIAAWFTEPAEQAAIDAWLALTPEDQQTCLNFLESEGRPFAGYRLYAAGRSSTPACETVPVWRAANDAIQARSARATDALRSGAAFLSFERKTVGAGREQLPVSAWRDLCLVEKLRLPLVAAWMNPAHYPHDYQAGHPMQPTEVSRNPSPSPTSVHVRLAKPRLRWGLQREWRPESVRLHRGTPAPERTPTMAEAAASECLPWLLARIGEHKASNRDVVWPPRDDWFRQAKQQFHHLTETAFGAAWKQAAEIHPEISKRGRPRRPKNP